MAFFPAIGEPRTGVKQNETNNLQKNLSYYLSNKTGTLCPAGQDSSDFGKTVRTSWIISPLCQRGSLAVEASLALPVFIFFFLHLISVLQFLSCYGRIEAALHQTGRKLSVYAYLCDREEQETGDTQALSEWAERLFQMTYTRAETERRAGREYLDNSPVLHGADGIHYLYSAYPEENNCIDLAAVYQVRPMLAFPGVMDIRLVNRCRMRAWTGYRFPSQEGEEGERMVYVTEQGNVYHLSASCTHIRLSVRQTSAGLVGSLRNAGGGKYYPCEICTSQNRQGNLCYITDQGDRYHHTVSCSGLKRSVRAVPVSEAGGRKACSRCG